MATIDYNYKFFLENGTELDLNITNEVIYVNILVPIINLDAINFNYSMVFSKQGFDIYDKNSDFYKDICITVQLNGNDIVIKDRKKKYIQII